MAQNFLRSRAVLRVSVAVALLACDASTLLYPTSICSPPPRLDASYHHPTEQLLTPSLVVGSKATATFTSAAGGKEESLSMKGNWRDSTADIVDETRNAVVARITRKSMFKSFTTFATGQNEYGLIVAPGVDFALMAALCVCFDELNNESSAA